MPGRTVLQELFEFFHFRVDGLEHFRIGRRQLCQEAACAVERFDCIVVRVVGLSVKAKPMFGEGQALQGNGQFQFSQQNAETPLFRLSPKLFQVVIHAPKV